MTFSFFRSDKLVYTNAWLRPISPCQPTQEMAGPVFSYLWNPHPTFPGRVHGFCHPGGRSDTKSSLVAITTMVSTSTTCVDHPLFIPCSRDLLSQQGYVSDGKSYRRLSCNTTKQQDFRGGL